MTADIKSAHAQSLGIPATQAKFTDDKDVLHSTFPASSKCSDKTKPEDTSPSYLNPFIQKFSNVEALNFLLTNRIPRATATRLIGRFSRIENKLLSRLSIATWKLFVDDLNLEEARVQNFPSMHHCFTRQLKEGARTVDMDPDIIVSPCDAIVGAHGKIDEDKLYQIKGFPYSLKDLLGDSIDTEQYKGGTYVTLRIKSSMYHRFHAPTDCKVKQINYISGDTWNVNPIALKRIEKLFCKNERAVIELILAEPQYKIALVPVAAILVASMKFHALDQTLDMDYTGPKQIACDADYRKGDEMGYFQHGSTIVVLSNRKFKCLPWLKEGEVIRMGMPLLQKLPNDQLAIKPQAI